MLCKKLIKRIILLVLCFGIIMTIFVLPASAGDITVILDDKEISFDQPPILYNDRTLVPMRKIFEELGYTVEWDGEYEEINVYSGETNIMTLWIDDYEMYVFEDGNFSDNYVELDVAPMVINGRTLVPVRAISESIGATVDWDDATQTVIINTK